MACIFPLIKTFKLTYRSIGVEESADSIFHETVDDQNNLLIIAKSGQFIAGGFTDQNFTGKFKSSLNTFLFSIDKNRQYKLKPEFTNCAISSNRNHGPVFGCCFKS